MGAHGISFAAGESGAAQTALAAMTARYGNVSPQEAGVIVALGGDGLMLRTLHAHMGLGVPIYGMHCGSVGFLMNAYCEENLHERLDAAVVTHLHPLVMHAWLAGGTERRAMAVNEVSLFRQTWQAAKLRIGIDGKGRMEELICDGALVSTPAGSTAYNLSVQGPIIPLGAPLLALTPISAFRPRRWRGALLPHQARVDFEILEHQTRPVNAVADHTEFRNVTRVQVEEDTDTNLQMMFDKDHSLEERILREQFLL